MSTESVRSIALDILREVLAYEGDFRDEMNFGELRVLAADFLDLNFRLTQKFGQDLSTTEIADKIRNFKGQQYDWITVGSYVKWVSDRLEALHIRVAA